MPFLGRQEQNANVREIAAGYGRHGDQWVNKVGYSRKAGGLMYQRELLTHVVN